MWQTASLLRATYVSPRSGHGKKSLGRGFQARFENGTGTNPKATITMDAKLEA